MGRILVGVCEKEVKKEKVTEVQQMSLNDNLKVAKRQRPLWGGG